MNITLFGFCAGQELSTLPTPAVICILDGKADTTLGDDVHHAFAYIPALLPHAISAKLPTTMLLVQIKIPKK